MPLEMCQLQAPAQLLFFHSLCALGRHRSEQVLQLRHRKLTSCLKEDQGYRVLEISYQHLNICQYFDISQKLVPSTGKNKTRLRLDQLGLSLLGGLHVCFVSFEGLTRQAEKGCRLEAPNAHSTQTRSYLAQLLSSLLQLGQLRLQHLPALAITGHHRSMMDSAA